MSVARDAVELRPSDIARASGLGERLATIRAFLCLVAVDVVLRATSFQRFYSLIRRVRARSRGTVDRETIAALCSSVDRAAVLYFKKAWCLQRSATAVCLLRRRGVPADLVIGIQRLPFYAHAWAELDGEVLNDRPDVQDRYIVIDRC